MYSSYHTDKKRKDYAVQRDQRGIHGKPELPFGLSQYRGKTGGEGRGGGSYHNRGTCMGHISIMVHLVLPLFLLVWLCM